MRAGQWLSCHAPSLDWKSATSCHSINCCRCAQRNDRLIEDAQRQHERSAGISAPPELPPARPRRASSSAWGAGGERALTAASSCATRNRFCCRARSSSAAAVLGAGALFGAGAAQKCPESEIPTRGECLGRTRSLLASSQRIVNGERTQAALHRNGSQRSEGLCRADTGSPPRSHCELPSYFRPSAPVPPHKPALSIGGLRGSVQCPSQPPHRETQVRERAGDCLESWLGQAFRFPWSTAHTAKALARILVAFRRQTINADFFSCIVMTRSSTLLSRSARPSPFSRPSQLTPRPHTPTVA
jgi:hypothetical protein